MIVSHKTVISYDKKKKITPQSREWNVSKPRNLILLDAVASFGSIQRFELFFVYV